jgi:hypothetical protein
MAEVTIKEFDRIILAFLGFLKKLKEQKPFSLDLDKVERVRKEVEELRLAALEAEIKAEYPNANLSPRLLSLIGTEPDLPLEEERQMIIEAVTWEER